MELFNLLGIGGTGLAIAAAILALFWKAEEAFSEEFQKALSHWLQRLNVDSPAPHWPDVFVTMFDRLFGSKHLSWRCFYRSCVASVIAVSLLLTIYMNINGLDPFLQYRNYFWILALSLASAGLCFNLIPDYISLLETRLLIRIIGRQESVVLVLLLLLLDLILTVVIFLFFGLLMLILVLFALKSAGFLVSVSSNAPTPTTQGPEGEFRLVEGFLGFTNILWRDGLRLNGEEGMIGIFFLLFFPNISLGMAVCFRLGCR